MHKVTLISLFVFILIALALAQDTTELKIIKAPQISLARINPVPNREAQAIQSQTAQAQDNINVAVQDTQEFHADTSGSVDFVIRIGCEKLTAMNLYEAHVLKTINSFHKILAMQKTRGLITQEQYETACRSLIQTFRSAMLTRPIFDKDQS
jgi:hypothetical protein